MKKIATIGLMTVLPLLAHHSIRADYDVAKVVDFKGTITKVEFINPHVRLFVDVVESDGKVTNWVFEMRPPSPLRRMGVNKDSFKEGYQISLDGWVAESPPSAY